MRLALATAAILPLAVLAQAHEGEHNATAVTNGTETNSTVGGNSTLHPNGTVEHNGTHTNASNTTAAPSAPATSKPSSGSTVVVPVSFGVGVAGLAMLLGVL